MADKSIAHAVEDLTASVEQVDDTARVLLGTLGPHVDRLSDSLPRIALSARVSMQVLFEALLYARTTGALPYDTLVEIMDRNGYFELTDTGRQGPPALDGGRR